MNKTKSITLKSISLVLILFVFFTTNAQKNLVPNSSFENYTICPNSVNNSPQPYPWFQPTNLQNQTASYFNSCSNHLYGIPYNVWGTQNARTGNAYSAISTISLQYPNSERYYLEVNLTDSLLKNKFYYAEFYVSNFNVIQYSSNNISLLFTKNKQYVDTLIDPLGVLQANPQIANFGNPIIADTLNWVKVSGIYKAQGGERYITIGNFKNNSQTNYLKLNNNSPNCICASYYLDDVSVIPLDSFCLKADAGRDTAIKVGDSVFIGSYTNGIDSLMWLQNGTTKYDSTRPGFWFKPTTTGTSFFVLQQTVNGCFSSDTVFVNVLLPLKFIDYSVSLRGTKQSVQNIWQTTNEINVSHFNIQRSTNGRDFITIGKVAAQNKNINNYEFIDNELPTTTDQLTIYYRLQSIDKDGKANYSTIQQINTKPQTPNIVLYPNPAKDYINITSQQNIKEIKIVNQLSQVIQYQTPNTKQITINTKQFAKGLYIIQCTTNNGETNTQKLIIE